MLCEGKAIAALAWSHNGSAQESIVLTSRFKGRVYRIARLSLSFPKLKLCFLDIVKIRIKSPGVGKGLTVKSATLSFFFLALFGMLQRILRNLVYDTPG